MITTKKKYKQLMKEIEEYTKKLRDPCSRMEELILLKHP